MIRRCLKGRLSSELLRFNKNNCKNCSHLKGEWFPSNNILRCASSVTAPPINDDGIINQFLKKVGWLDHNKTRLKVAGYYLYECVPTTVDYLNWFKVCQLPDTFTSWFCVTELHVWLLMVRCMSEDVLQGAEMKYIKDGEGRFIRNAIVEAMWADVASRSKLLEGASQVLLRKQIVTLSEQFHAVLMGYDEGLDDDRTLAAAIWRRFYQMETVDVEKIEHIVNFIRRQIMELEKMPPSIFKMRPDIKWAPLNSKY